MRRVTVFLATTSLVMGIILMLSLYGIEPLPDLVLAIKGTVLIAIGAAIFVEGVNQ